MENCLNLLFYIESQKVNTYLYANKKFISIESGGEKDILYDQKFQKWLKSAISYEDNFNCLDTVIITDSSINIELNEFSISENTSWKCNDLSIFIEKYLNSTIVNIERENESIVIITYQKNGFSYKNKEMYTKAILQNGISFDYSIDDVVITTNDEESYLFKYYSNKIKKEKKNI